jgi:phosphoglucosamine mutase
MKRLFGTDGIRGVAGEHPLDPATARRFGAALAEVLRSTDSTPRRVVLGRDTRESGPWLRDAVASGLVSRGTLAVDAGIIPTPGLAHVLLAGRFDAGVMISASHNPYRDNGLKAFGGDGTKLSDELENRIEALILDHGGEDPGEDATNPALEDKSLLREYLGFLEGIMPSAGRFDGMRLLLDCANGAACTVAPEVFRHHGAEVATLGDAPDGKNINRNCGSLHLDGLASAVVDGGFDMGLAFDGDADRCLAVDRKGRIVDGDHILYITGCRLKRAGALRGNAVVATIMSNYWLEEELGREGINLHRAPVGDKYVLDRMISENLVLGGEQSGHVIFRDHASTGDGVLTGILLVETLISEEQPLEEIMDGIVPYPQMLINVRVREKPDLQSHPRVGPVVADIQSALAGSGRLVLRYSGTEPLARVMIEGREPDVVRDHAERLAAVIKRELGA